MIDEQEFKRMCEELEEFSGIEEVFLLDTDGKVLFKNKEFALSEAEALDLLGTWREKGSSITFQNNRYAVLKNDEIQLAAKNIREKKGNIVGSITKDGDYLVAHTREEGMILLEWSILINKIAWKKT